MPPDIKMIFGGIVSFGSDKTYYTVWGVREVGSTYKPKITCIMLNSGGIGIHHPYNKRALSKWIALS